MSKKYPIVLELPQSVLDVINRDTVSPSHAVQTAVESMQHLSMRNVGDEEVKFIDSENIAAVAEDVIQIWEACFDETVDYR